MMPGPKACEIGGDGYRDRIAELRSQRVCRPLKGGECVGVGCQTGAGVDDDGTGFRGAGRQAQDQDKTGRAYLGHRSSQGWGQSLLELLKAPAARGHAPSVAIRYMSCTSKIADQRVG